MYYRPFRRRPHYTYANDERRPSAAPAPPVRRLILLLAGTFIIVLIFSSMLLFTKIASKIAVSDARDAVGSCINAAVAQIMSESGYSADSFVSYEKSEDGIVTLISSNMVEINALSAELLSRLVDDKGSRLVIKIPMGNLTGISFFMGSGTDVPVEVVILTSSRAEFTNNIVSAGINQTKHQINLLLTVDLDVIIPWGIESTTVEKELLIADTVIAGRVPDTYLNMK